MLLELCEGGDLFKLISDQKGLKDKVLLKQLFTKICKATEELHNTLSVAHLDIKPENFLFDKEGNIKMSDLGLSKSLNNDV